MSTDTDADENLEGQIEDTSARTSGDASREAAEGMEEQSQSVVDYYKARREGLRDRHSQKILPPQPQFYDSQAEAPVNKQNVPVPDESESDGGEAQGMAGPVQMPIDNETSGGKPEPPASEVSSAPGNEPGDVKPVAIAGESPPVAGDGPEPAGSQQVGDRDGEPTSYTNDGPSTSMQPGVPSDAPLPAVPHLDDPATPVSLSGPGHGVTAPEGDSRPDVAADDHDEPAAPGISGTTGPQAEPHDYAPSPVVPHPEAPVIGGSANPPPLVPPEDEGEHPSPGSEPTISNTSSLGATSVMRPPEPDLDDDSALPVELASSRARAETSSSNDIQTEDELAPAIKPNALAPGADDIKGTAIPLSSTEAPARSGEVFSKEASAGRPEIDLPGGAGSLPTSEQPGRLKPPSPNAPAAALGSPNESTSQVRTSGQSTTPTSAENEGASKEGNIRSVESAKPQRDSATVAADISRLAGAVFADPKTRGAVVDILKRLDSGTLKAEQLDPLGQKIFAAIKGLEPQRLEQLKQLLAVEASPSRKQRPGDTVPGTAGKVADNVRRLDSALPPGQARKTLAGAAEPMTTNKSRQELNLERAKPALTEGGKIVRTIKDLAPESGKAGASAKELPGRNLELTARLEKSRLEKTSAFSEAALTAKLTPDKQGPLKGLKDSKPETTKSETGGSSVRTGQVEGRRSGPQPGDPPYADSDAVSDSDLSTEKENEIEPGSIVYQETLECVFFKERRRQYLVQEMDTLESIAAKMLRNAKLAPLILEINHNIIPVVEENGEKVVALTPPLAIWLPTTADIKYFLADSPGVAEDDKLDFRPAQSTSGGALTPEEELAAKFGGRPEDYRVEKVEERQVQSLVEHLGEVCRLVKSSERGRQDAALESRLEVKSENGEWLPIVTYEIHDDVSWRHEFTPDGKRTSIGYDLPPHTVVEIADNDLGSNWQNYCQTFLSSQAMR